MIQRASFQAPALIQAKVLDGILHAAGLARLDAARLLAGEGLRPDSLTGTGATIPLATYMRLFDRLARTMARPSLGLDLANRLGPGLVGPIGYMLLFSPTLAAGLEAFSESVFSIQGVTSLAFLRAPRPMLVYAISDDTMRPRRHDVEFSLGYVHHLIRLALGETYAPREIYFEHARTGDLARYEAFFGCPVYFEQDCNALVLNDDDPLRPMQRADPTLAAMLRHYITLMDSRDAAPSSVSESVDRILSGIIGTQPAMIRHVAARLDKSPDTLRRDLRTEGASFRHRLRKGRVSMACRLLLESNLSILEVASRVGYAETASFSRAFVAEMGEAPVKWRRKNRH